MILETVGSLKLTKKKHNLLTHLLGVCVILVVIDICLNLSNTIDSLTVWFLCCVLSIRVPDDSDSQSGVIRQRQNCLESRRVEGQELPVLTLVPCIGREGVPAINQVGQLGFRNTKRGFAEQDKLQLEGFQWSLNTSQQTVGMAFTRLPSVLSCTGVCSFLFDTAKGGVKVEIEIQLIRNNPQKIILILILCFPEYYFQLNVQI